MLTKADWRHRAKQARDGIVVDAEGHCEALAGFLSSNAVKPGWVVGYHAFGNEVDLSLLFARSGLGPFGVTRTPESGVDLTVHPLDSPMERHHYGFEQPVVDAPRVDLEEIAAVLVPGLAFDRLGTRLGRGKGYYDRLLGRLSTDVALVGITGGYIVAELPADEHDVAMTHLAGEFGVDAVPLGEPSDE